MKDILERPRVRPALVGALALVAILLVAEIAREVGTFAPSRDVMSVARTAAPQRAILPMGPQPPSRRIDYSDPVGMGQAPLIPIRGLSDYYLSPNFTIGDLAGSDSAGYARISFKLVDALEAIRAELGADIYVNSGYRHAALNGAEHVGGAEHSQHIAGRAADIASAYATPLELAVAALRVVGCGIGIGLGETYVHVDVRGTLATWTKDGAELSEEAFDAWAPRVCIGADSLGVEEALQLAADVSDSIAVRSIRLALEDTTGVDSTMHLGGWMAGGFGPHAGLPGPAYAKQFNSEMRAFARLMRRRAEEGVVLLEVAPDDSSAAPYRLSAIPREDSLIVALGLADIVDGTSGGRYFVYVVRAESGVDVGVSTLE